MKENLNYYNKKDELKYFNLEDDLKLFRWKLSSHILTLRKPQIF